MERWKEKILLAVGRNGAVVTEIVPELEWLIGKQTPAAELPPKEAESRFLMVFAQFIKVFASKTQPLVLFLDDLQWADPALISLLKYLVQDANIDYLMIIGVFRENEVDEAHPLAKVLEAVKEQPNVTHLSLGPLKIADVEKMLTELFNTERNNIADLAADLYRKSGGNPFFLRQLLVYLKEEGFLYFDANGICWRWQMEAIQKLQPGDDVINLIVKRLKKLPKDAYEIIKAAACIGNRFDLQTLSAICGKSEEETASFLKQLVHEGLLMQVDKTNQFPEPSDGKQLIFEFLHDKVQQAVYSPIAEAEKKERHMTIGRLLFEKASGNYLEEKILTIMEHFNRSLEIISDPKERIRLASYNLIAGRKAKASAAYQSALKYFLAGKTLLGDNAWETVYQLCYDLHLELAQMEYFLGNEKTAEELFDIVIEKAPNELERASVYGLKVILYAGIGKYSDAVHTCIQALEKLGLKIPVQPTKLDYVKELLLYKWLMRGKKIEDLAALPEMNDRKKRKIAELLSRLSSVTMLSYPDLHGFIILKAGNYAAQNGNTEMTSVGYLGYAITSGIVFGDYEAGEKYGEVSIQLVEKYDRSASKCITYFVVGGLIAHWTQHAAVGLEYL
ncbi:MAG TPA: AAA family ATPase, partial [Clostridiales bacterium]|nr:AAA family ATPase [Clostridiales bacterium]